MSERFTINDGKKAHTPQKQGTKADRVQALCGAYAFKGRDHLTYNPVTFENERDFGECPACNKRKFLSNPTKLRL